MADKRDLKRYRKRFQLRFGIEEPSRIGFTEDISRDGLFIKTTNTLLPGTKIIIDLTVPDQGIIRAEGVVQWVRKVPPTLIHLVKKSGMGIRITKILSGEDMYQGIFSKIHF